MKKLVITACAIALAAATQASTVKWTAQNVYAGDTENKCGSSYMAWYIDSSAFSLADATAALEKGDVSFVSEYGYANAAFVDNKGNPTGASAGAKITESAGNPETFKGYLVVLDSSTIADATKAYVSGEVSKTTGETAGQGATLSFTSHAASQTANGWYAIPEPTSGLLLLLGVAGLALKRRRA